MGFFIDLLGAAFEAVNRKTSEMDKEYTEQSERYEHMSDSRLQRTYQYLASDGNGLFRMAEYAACKDEMRRRGLL